LTLPHLDVLDVGADLVGVCKLGLVACGHLFGDLEGSRAHDPVRIRRGDTPDRFEDLRVSEVPEGQQDLDPDLRSRIVEQPGQRWKRRRLPDPTEGLDGRPTGVGIVEHAGQSLDRTWIVELTEGVGRADPQPPVGVVEEANRRRNDAGIVE
jgi:hypothetical protein